MFATDSGPFQMLTPNASFIGHLSGILVGLAYTMGPLKIVVDILEDILPFRFGELFLFHILDFRYCLLFIYMFF